MDSKYPGQSWSLFSLQGQKNNCEFKKNMKKAYDELAQAFCKDTSEFEEYMEINHDKLDFYNQHVYEQFFHDLLCNVKDFDERICQNTLTLLYYFRQKNFSYKTNLDYANVNITFLKSVLDEAEYQDNLSDPDDWTFVFLYLNDIAHSCMKSSFDNLNYNQINEIMGNFPPKLYAQFLLDYVDYPTAYYANDESHEIEDRIPVLWAMVLNHEVQEPFKFDHLRIVPNFKFPFIVEFFSNLKDYYRFGEKDGIEENLNKEQKRVLSHLLDCNFYAYLLQQISLHEDENLKYTKDMLDKGFGFDFKEINGMSLSEYYNKLYMDSGKKRI